MRICPKCKIEKELTEYWRTCSYCKDCQRECTRIKDLKYKEIYSERRKEKWKKDRSRRCKECGNSFIGKGLIRKYCSTKCKLFSEIEKNNGCWEWQGELHPQGYAYTTCYETGKREQVHRVSYRIFKEEIPHGLLVCHTCDNRRCINPDHLWIGTHKENSQDAKRKGRLEHVKLMQSKGEEKASSKLNNEKVREIREEIKKGIRCTVIARKFGVNSTTIYSLRDGKTWSHVT